MVGQEALNCERLSGRWRCRRSAGRLLSMLTRALAPPLSEAREPAGLRRRFPLAGPDVSGREEATPKRYRASEVFRRDSGLRPVPSVVVAHGDPDAWSGEVPPRGAGPTRSDRSRLGRPRSSRCGSMPRVRELEPGADDYIVKPCSPTELVARIETVLRRSMASLSAEPSVAS